MRLSGRETPMKIKLVKNSLKTIYSHGTLKIVLDWLDKICNIKAEDWDVPKGTKSLTITKKLQILAVKTYPFKVHWLYLSPF